MSSNGHQPLHPSRIDMAPDIRVKVNAVLNRTLAATLDLKTQVKQAHWTVKGLDFYQLHELFDDMATELEEFIDMVAERVTALGGTPLGTARIAAAQSFLPEYPLDLVAGEAHIVALAERYAAYGKSVREAIAETDLLEDADTADLYTEISRAIDKRLWFLDAHVAPTEMASATSNGDVTAAKTTKKTTRAKRK